MYQLGKEATHMVCNDSYIQDANLNYMQDWLTDTVT